MKTYEMPAPPPSWVKEVRDVDGRAYQRLTEDGEYWRDEGTRTTFGWQELLWNRGPIEADE